MKIGFSWQLAAIFAASALLAAAIVTYLHC
jgi:hypothetical protein